MNVKTVSEAELNDKVNAILGKKSFKSLVYDQAAKKLTFAGKAVVTATLGAAIGITWWGVKAAIASTTGTEV